MADSSDSENEVFFGPVSEKERRKIAELSKRKSGEPPEHSLDPTIMSHQSGEEGLHALAMAAQMLSISSCQRGHIEQEESPLSAEIKEDKEQVESNDAASSKDIPSICIGDYTNDGNHLELDAVKFLTQRLPENQNNSGDSIVNTEYTQKNSCETGYLHHTSFASSVNDSHDEMICLDNSLDIPQDYSNQHLMNHDCLSAGLNVLEANVKMEDLRIGAGNSNVGTANMAIKEVKIEDISTSDRLINMKFSHIDWQDANEISRSDFGIKVSDNEEDMEKVERNLKVEEIIKFLADEEVEVKSENGISDCFPIYDLSLTKSSSNVPESNPSPTKSYSNVTERNVSPTQSYSNVTERNLSHTTSSSTVTESKLSDELPNLKCNLLQVDSSKVCKEELLDGSPKKIVGDIPENIVGKSFENEKVKRLRTPNQVHSKAAQTGKKCSIPLPQRDCGKIGTPFKTPNSKPKPTSVSKIPHLSHPATPSPRKNNKFAGIVSPVAQYIHGTPVLLISNNKAVGRNINSSSKTKSSNKPTGSMFENRGAENVDVNNIPCVQLAENVRYKHATPLNIVSANKRTFKSGIPLKLLNKNKGEKVHPL